MDKSMRDYISSRERLTNPYVNQILKDVFVGVVAAGLTVLFIWQVVIDITN